MIDFSSTTAFRVVRRLALGRGSTAMYLLICEEGTQSDIEADLQSEVEVQLGATLAIGPISELLPQDDYVRPDGVNLLRALRIDRCSPELIALLDTHVIRLERTGAQFLFLTTDKLSEEVLVAAPNFRNRLTDVLRILPDDLPGAALN